MIPVCTTTITVTRVAGASGDWDGPPRPVAVAAGVRAHINVPGGSELEGGPTQEQIRCAFQCDVVAGLDHLCRVVDDTTGQAYDVVWVRQVSGFGELDHMSGQLLAVTGAAS